MEIINFMISALVEHEWLKRLVAFLGAAHKHISGNEYGSRYDFSTDQDFSKALYTASVGIRNNVYTDTDSTSVRTRIRL